MQLVNGLALIAIPALLAYSGWRATSHTPASAGQCAKITAGSSLFISLAISLFSIVSEQKLHAIGMHATTMGLIMLVVVSFIGLIVIQFSRHYLAGESRQLYFFRWVQLTLASVALVVISNNMLLFWLAWVAISLSLHQLLMFYPERPRAALAAHKKFLFARLAEILLMVAFILLYIEHQTLALSEILSHYQPNVELSFISQLAALFIAAVALIKCAQLPVHGWLIQVVESPTPVSAMLHGGIINLGGFLLISFSPIFMQASAAQWLVLIVAGLSTVLAALIMMTRVSIKVRLAWSTCAQMGLMLVECALGLYELALLHLVAHSCYKAHAFLSSGSEVERHLQLSLARRDPLKPVQLLLPIMISAGLTSLFALTYYGLHGTSLISPWVLIGMALSLLLVQRNSTAQRKQFTKNILYALSVLSSYTLLKFACSQLLPPQTASAGAAADGFITLLLGVFYISYLMMVLSASSKLIDRVQTYLYAGLYLDEWATRITLKIWPTELPLWENAKQHPSLSLEKSL